MKTAKSIHIQVETKFLHRYRGGISPLQCFFTLKNFFPGIQLNIDAIMNDPLRKRRIKNRCCFTPLGAQKEHAQDPDKLFHRKSFSKYAASKFLSTLGVYGKSDRLVTPLAFCLVQCQVCFANQHIHLVSIFWIGRNSQANGQFFPR